MEEFAHRLSMLLAATGEAEWMTNLEQVWTWLADHPDTAPVRLDHGQLRAVLTHMQNLFCAGQGLRGLPIPWLCLDETSRIVGANPAFIRLLGRKDDILHKPVTGYLTSEAAKRFHIHFHRALKYGRAATYLEIQGSKTILLPVEMIGRNRTDTEQEHRQVDLLVMGIIHEQMASTVKLRHSGQKVLKNTAETVLLLKNAIETVGIGVTITDTEQNIVYTNQAEARMHGYDVSELIGQNARIFSPSKYWKDIDYQRLKMAHNWRREGINVRKDGSRFPVSLVSTCVRNRKGEPIGLVTVCEDITERKQAEKELYRYNRQLHVLREIDREILAAGSAREIAQAALGRIRELIPCQHAVVMAFADDYKTAEVIALESDISLPIQAKDILAVHDIGYLQSLKEERIFYAQQLAQQAGSSEYEATLLAHGIVSIMAVPLIVQQRLIGCLTLGWQTALKRPADKITAMAKDIANLIALGIQQANLYQRILRDAETKDILLKEVNHRVKNNLSAIIGLLYAEYRHVTEDVSSQPLIGKLIGRIQGMAAVHQLLSENEWKPIRLSALAGQIIQTSLEFLPEKKRVLYTVQPSSVHVTPKQASHLALVLNELATNTVKYALAQRDAARIQVAIEQHDRTVHLTFRDDGPGYPATTLSLDKHNVGFYLIKNIVRSSMNGSLTLKNDNGAVTGIRFDQPASGDHGPTT